jgi:hypothetical protein
MIELLRILEYMKPKKTVSFYTTVHVIYIPSHRCRIYNDFRDELWWNDDDYEYFENSSRIEIQGLLKRHPRMNCKDAMKLLYQSTIVYDKNNFDSNFDSNFEYTLH